MTKIDITKTMTYETENSINSDEEPLDDVRILVPKEEEENEEKTPISNYDKITFFLFGIIFCLLLLNILKFFGYWPYRVEIEIVTDPDIEITWQSMPANLHVTHTTVSETAHALVQNRR